MLMLICWHAGAAEAAAAAAVLVVGIGVAFGSLTTLIVQAVAAHQTGVASGMNANIRTSGGSIDTTLFPAVLAGGGTDRAPSTHAYNWAFALLALLAVLGAAVSLLVPGGHTRTEPPPTAGESLRTSPHSPQGAPT
jgi:MFS family permease